MGGRMVEGTASVALPVDASAPGVAREFGKSFLRNAGLDCQGLDLVISELVTNAVRHGSHVVELTLRRDGAGVTVAVRDDSGDVPIGRDATESDHEGRGLAIVDALAGGWTVARHEDGTKTVGARLRCTPA
jgi:anti-sigma regulatory factor (Ser/Thr protein kinase)